MDTLINRILELAGDMPDVAAHRRYLKSLSEPVLQARLKLLQADQNKSANPRWQHHVPKTRKTFPRSVFPTPAQGGTAAELQACLFPA